MNCGDVVYRSTLDPVLRKEVTGPDWKAFTLLGAIGLYLLATPGVLPGFVDYYILAPLQRRTAKVYDKSDIKLGRKLGSGGFGSVFKGEIMNDDGTTTPVVVKKAKEFGEAEVWMNERLSRYASTACAEFITGFRDKAANNKDEAIWLVWKDEGDYTLFDLMQKKEFPYNVEEALFGRELKLPKGRRRKLATIRLLMQQTLEALRDLHATGIVHRDIKPQNMIVSLARRKLVLIDLGAAADLRIGINYSPSEYLLDPRYAPPQQYIMSTQTPNPPPKPVAALLSPVLWRMEQPDKFDVYSAGVTLLQMAFPNLRSDNNLIAFNRKLADCNYDLNKWRSQEVAKGKLSKDLEEGFQLLDCDGGAGWDLLCQLMSYEPGDRPSAAAALAHPFLAPETSTITNISAPISSALQESVGSMLASADELLPASMLEDAVAKGALTEAQLAQEFGYGREMRKVLRANNTIAWFETRQSDLQRRLEEQRRKQGTQGVNGTGGRTPSGTGSKVVGSGKVAVGNGKAAAVNVNGAKVAANGNGAKAAANANGKLSKPSSPAASKPATPAGTGSVQVVKEKVRELVNVFGGKR